jgi:predicted phosphodiesterase
MATKLATFSDVHGDLQALQDALREARRLGCTRFVCAGDVVDTGLFHDETVALLRTEKIPTVRGNHDRWAVEGGSREAGPSACADLLSPRTMRWLKELPTAWAEWIDDVHVVVTHARPGSDMNGISPREARRDVLARMLDDTMAGVLVVGHTHEAFELKLADGRKVVNPAALLRDAADPDEEAPCTGTFGVLELPSRGFTVHRAKDGTEVDVVRRGV